MSNLAQVNELYQALSNAQMRMQIAQEELEAAHRDYARLTVDLGDVLSSLGMASVTMQDGHTLGLATSYFGSAAQERMPAIRRFLAAQGAEGLLKPKKINIGDMDPNALPDELRDKVEYEINTNTLKAFLKELAASGKMTEEVRDLFKVHQENKVIIK